MAETKLPPWTDSHLPARTLKIEAEGDLWKGLLRPKIRLMGRWLERAGFRPGTRVHVACVAPGVIELRTADSLLANEPKSASEKSLKNAEPS